MRTTSPRRTRDPSVHADSEDPIAEVFAAKDKGSKARRKPLTQVLASRLRAMRPAMALPLQRVFAGLMTKKGMKYLHEDLRAAGIPIKDSRGWRVDFHVLRHTACTIAGGTGVIMPMLQGFAGHVDLGQVKRYSHNEHEAQRQLVASLPNLWATDGPRLGTRQLAAQGREQSERVATATAGDTHKSSAFKVSGGVRRELSQLDGKGFESGRPDLN